MSSSLLEYHVLLALAAGALHGYAIAERVAAESAARCARGPDRCTASSRG